LAEGFVRGEVAVLGFDLRVLDPDYLPRRLLFRERQLNIAVNALLARQNLVVVGEPGMGKSTLVKMALASVKIPHVYIDCGQSRTYTSIRRKVRTDGLNVLDDFTLVKYELRLEKLVTQLPWKILVVHPVFRPRLQRLYALGLQARTIEMPPYTPSEIYAIIEDRVIAGNLPASEEALQYLAARVKNPRKALNTLRKAIQQTQGKEIQPKHIQQVLTTPPPAQPPYRAGGAWR